MGEKEMNDLFYVCSLIEYVGRRMKNRRGDVVAADEALDCFYRSQTYELMRDGISDMHCMSDEYLVDELVDERYLKGTQR